MKEQVMEKLQALVDHASDSYDYRIMANDWQKYGKDRTYFKIRETRQGGKHCKDYDFGWLDNQTNEYHNGTCDAFGKYTLSGALIDW